jgi:hypothetical protein
MPMKAGWLLVGAAVAMAGVGLMAASGAQDRRNRSSRDWDNGKNWNWNIHTRTDGEALTGCNDIEATVSRGEMARDEEVQNVAASALNVVAHQNGPLYITGAGRNPARGASVGKHDQRPADAAVALRPDHGADDQRSDVGEPGVR